MTTIQGFAVRPRRSLAALATALAATGLAVGSGADFTSRSANPANTFTAGTLTSDNSRDGAAVFSPSGMTPGGAPQTGTVDIANSGDLGAAFTLTRDRLESTDTGASNPTAFAAQVDLVVTDCGAFDTAAPACGDAGDRGVYDGTLAALDAPTALGDFAAGDKHRYAFAASLNAAAGNEYQGDGSSARFVWDAAQK
jgi:spore coat-associated protein N